ncbi:heme exporter protein CcmD [Idiomarina seosinensis]|uniref:Heme exporter protein D n=1 Tax=Idiomarina seosinensis TaxID=281739 RepID=A0A432ZGP0_9GAMM|nr:heme exporter protein CcmD [Idiomarina seosinensis]RUO77073.1 heme exporter protein CcmD [Idiomarina seosinensis]
MAFESFGEFLQMGGYGFYVWLSFFLSFLVIAGVALDAALGRRRLQRQSQTLQRRKRRLAKRQQSPVKESTR